MRIYPLVLIGLIFSSAAPAGELRVYEHNGSIIDWFVADNTIVASYETPRPGLKEAGIQEGSVLFRYEGARISGSAYTFKVGCTAASYQVTGSQDGKFISLHGPAPVRAKKGCAVVGYSQSSPHANLVFIATVP